MARELVFLGDMRKSRKKTLANTGQYHKMWRGHNREPVLETDDDKKAYLDELVDTFTEPS